MGLTENMKVWEEETFGPLAAIKVFEKEEEVEKVSPGRETLQVQG